MRTLIVVFLVSALVPVALASSPSAPVVAQASSPALSQPASRPPAEGPGARHRRPKALSRRPDGAVVTLRGTVEAIDKEKQTVTLKGPKRTLVVHVQDPKKLDAIKVGDPVVGKYYEALAFEVKKAGTATPGMTAQQGVASSKPSETPAGAVGQQVTVTVTITEIDKKAGTVTVKGPEGRTETIKARDPKNLDAVKVDDLVEITYTRALAIALDKSATK